MKVIFIFFLFFSLQSFSQDWSITTHNRTVWTMAGIDGRDTIVDTSYQCVITKNGTTITFSHTVKGKIHITTIPFGEQGSFPAKDHSDPPWIKNMGICTAYYTDGQGVILYFPAKKKVIRMWPRNWKYVYY
jgi:hypothetical protein